MCWIGGCRPHPVMSGRCSTKFTGMRCLDIQQHARLWSQLPSSWSFSSILRLSGRCQRMPDLESKTHRAHEKGTGKGGYAVLISHREAQLDGWVQEVRCSRCRPGCVCEAFLESCRVKQAICLMDRLPLLQPEQYNHLHTIMSPAGVNGQSCLMRQ